MVQRFCPKCGTQLIDNASFCHICGANNTPSPPSDSLQGAYQPLSVQPVCCIKPKIPGRGFGISAMVLGILAIFYCSGMMLNTCVTINEYSELFIIGFSSRSYLNSIKNIQLSSILHFAVLPLLGVIFGFCALRRGYTNHISKSGIVLGVIGLTITLISFLLLFFHT